LNNRPTTGKQRERVAARFFVHNQVQIVHILAVSQGKKRRQQKNLPKANPQLSRFQIKENIAWNDLMFLSKEVLNTHIFKSLEINFVPLHVKSSIFKELKTFFFER
jgi:hypothetical protein